MSCTDCDNIQELNRKGQNTLYQAIGEASVIIGACDKHAHSVLQALKVRDSLKKHLVLEDDHKLPRVKSIFLEK